MTNQAEHLLDWLRDAHAMEQQTETLLKGQADRIENYPELKLRIQNQLEATRRHQRAINNCIQRLGGDNSTIKDLTAKLMATGQNLIGTAMSDEVVKGAMTLYVFTHVAISSYTVLIAAAEAINDTETADTCKLILEEEITMSKWLLSNLPQLTQSFLHRSESSKTAAKR